MTALINVGLNYVLITANGPVGAAQASALAFFVIGLIAMFLGMNNIAGMSVELGKLLLIAFLALAVVSFVFSLISGGRSRPPI